MSNNRKKHSIIRALTRWNRNETLQTKLTSKMIQESKPMQLVEREKILRTTQKAHNVPQHMRFCSLSPQVLKHPNKRNERPSKGEKFDQNTLGCKEMHINDEMP